MASKKKVSQKDLRQMMKERKELQSKEVTKNESKIESPLARYDSIGQLSCILCDIQIKSDSLWSSHIIAKIHKNKLEEIKRKKLNQKLNEEKSIEIKIESKQEAMKPLLKRKIDSNNDNEINNKLIKKSININNNENNRNTYEMIESNNKSMNNLSFDSNSVESEAKGLPNDFFDNSNELKAENEKIDSKDSEIELDSNCLPKGFFDDPKQDAKARHVVFKDPIDEEWDKFQKVIAEETNASQTIIEEDIEEIQVDRNLEEIEEQISIWAKVEEMQKKAEELHNDSVQKSDIKTESESSDSSDVDEQELNVFSNWRSRGALNSK